MSPSWWKDQNLKLVNKLYEEATIEMKKDLEKAEVIGIFFASYQNRPSRILTHFLSVFHQNVRREFGPRFQVIFVPMDETEKDCQDFVKVLHGNWLTLPWSNQGVRRNVRNQYNVISFPWITVVKNSPEGPVVTQEGKEDIQELGIDAFHKWVQLAKNVQAPQTKK